MDQVKGSFVAGCCPLPRLLVRPLSIALRAFNLRGDELATGRNRSVTDAQSSRRDAKPGRDRYVPCQKRQTSSLASQHLRGRPVRRVHAPDDRHEAGIAVNGAVLGLQDQGPFDLVVRQRMARPDVFMLHVDLQSRQGVGYAARRPASKRCHLAVAMDDSAGQDGRWSVGVVFDHAVAGIECLIQAHGLYQTAGYFDAEPSELFAHGRDIRPVAPGCPRRPNFDHPCRLNIDQGWKAARSAAVCG